MDRQQDCEESDGELRLFTITHTLVHASGTTATTTRPGKSQKKGFSDPRSDLLCPREDSSVSAPGCPGETHGLVKDGHVLV